MSKELLYKIGIGLIFAFYFATGLYFSLNTKYGVPPDEFHHIALSQRYKESYGLIEDSEYTYHFGQVSRQPFLYHWTMGRVLQVNDMHFEEESVLRVSSFLVSNFTILLYLLIARELTKSRIVQLASLFITVSTLMFIFMAGSINYDTFLLLFTTLSIYFLIRFVKYNQIDNLFLIALSLSLGALTKISILPIALVVALIALWHLLTHPEIIKNQKWFRNWSSIPLLVVTMLSIGLNLWFYGGNLIEYQALVPECESILKEEYCLRSAQILRDRDLINNRSTAEIMDPISYAGIWLFTVFSGMFGISAHLPLYRSFIALMGHFALFGAGVFSLIRQIKITDKLNMYMLVIVGFYSVFLMYFVNYYSYVRLNNATVGLNGRYLFPIYFFAIFLLVRYLFTNIASSIIRRSLFLLIIFWCIYSGIGFYYKNAYPELVKDCNFVIELTVCEDHGNQIK